MTDIYREQIIELAKKPNNFGNLENPNFEKKGVNPICGDKLEVQINVEDEIVKEIKFSGVSCAISTASASLITDKVKGMKVSEVFDLGTEEVLNLLGVEIGPVRIKCAMLILDTIKEALKNDTN